MKSVVFIPEPTAASDLDLLRARCECLTPWEGNVAPPAELQNDSSFRVVLHEADAVIVRLFKIRKEGMAKAKTAGGDRQTRLHTACSVYVHP